MLRNINLPALFTGVVSTFAYYCQSRYSNYDVKADAPSLNDMFEEYKVEQDLEQPSDKFQSDFSHIVLHQLDPDKLPYREFYTEAYLEKIKSVRYSDCRIVGRGDLRSPSEIVNVGGFHPQYTNPDSKPKEGVEILDVFSHQYQPEGSGLVSFTSDPNVMHRFGRVNASKVKEADKINKYYVYSVAVSGSIGIYPVCNPEKEIAVPGGVDDDAIVAYRECVNENKSRTKCSSLFFNKKFDPELMKEVAKANLRVNESCPRLGLGILTKNS